MAFTVLDIGAGSLVFAKGLRQLNRTQQMLIFCGEPAWGIGPFFRSIPKESVERFLERGDAGIHRITASYSSFNLPDASLDLVCLNSPHPFSMFGREQQQLASEVDRCLKPGGLFFSSYSAMDLGNPPKTFIEVGGGRWQDPWEYCEIEGSPIRFPQSPTVAVNISGHRAGIHKNAGSGYLYRDGICPGYRLWRKPA